MIMKTSLIEERRRVWRVSDDKARTRTRLSNDDGGRTNQATRP